jgi:hypothetical protein
VAKKPAAKPKPGVKPVKIPDVAAGVPSGPRLTAAQQSLRDSWMVVRISQGWTFPEVAAEAKISVSQAKRAVKAKREAMPALLEQDPVEIITYLVEGFQASIGDFEKMALAYSQAHPSAAVGAKKAANDARASLTTLLQSVRVLPHDLGTMRHLVDLRAVVAAVIDGVEAFEKKVEEEKLPKAKREPVLAAAHELTEKLEKVAGLEDLPPASGNGSGS